MTFVTFVAGLAALRARRRARPGLGGAAQAPVGASRPRARRGSGAARSSGSLMLTRVLAQLGISRHAWSAEAQSASHGFGIPGKAISPGSALKPETDLRSWQDLDIREPVTSTLSLASFAASHPSGCASR